MISYCPKVRDSTSSGTTRNLTGKDFFENVLREERYEVLARKAPQVAEYSQGLSRASTCVSLFIECRVKDELCRRRIRRSRRHAVLHPTSALSEKVFSSQTFGHYQ